MLYLTLSNNTLHYIILYYILYYIGGTHYFYECCRIDENFVIKVADFGLSEDVYARNYFRQGRQGEDGEAPVKLPVRWMAVESLNDGVFSEKTDVVRCL